MSHMDENLRNRCGKNKKKREYWNEWMVLCESIFENNDPRIFQFRVQLAGKSRRTGKLSMRTNFRSSPSKNRYGNSKNVKVDVPNCQRKQYGTVAMATKWRLPMTTSCHNENPARSIDPKIPEIWRRSLRIVRDGASGRGDALFVEEVVDGQRPFWSAGGCGAGRTGRRPWASRGRGLRSARGPESPAGRGTHMRTVRSLGGGVSRMRTRSTERRNPTGAHRTLHWLNNTAQRRAALLNAAGAASEEPTVKFEFEIFSCGRFEWFSVRLF